MSNVTTRKRGNRWEYRFEGISVNGKRKQFSKCGFLTKRDALNAGIEAYNEYRTNGRQSLSPKEISVSDYLDKWFDLYVRTELKYNTQIGYRRIIDTHLKSAFGDYPIQSLTPTLIIEYMNSLKIEGYSQSMLTNILTTFSSAIDYAVEPLHLIGFNPIKSVKVPKSIKKKEELVILDKDDVSRILNRFNGTRFFVPICLGYFLGLRISETCGLTWDCVNFDKNEIRIERQIIEQYHNENNHREEHASWFFGSPKKDSFRTIQFGDTLRSILLDELARQNKNEDYYGEYFTIQVLKNEFNHDNGETVQRIISCEKALESKLERVKFICIDENGELTTPHTIKYASRIINKAMGIKFNYHALRHTHASELIESGISPKSVQTRLGHKNIETTMNTYVHDTPKMKDTAVSEFEKIAHGLNFSWSNRGQNSISEDSEIN